MREHVITDYAVYEVRFPFLFGGTFIEGTVGEVPLPGEMKISLPFRRDFH